MKRRTATCPACGGPVEFKLGTALVTVCEFCRSVVARADKSVEDHGKVADLVDTGSRLSRGAAGRFEKKHFDVVGRVQYQHPAGGCWDEWYLQFPGERVKWLAEAQGKLYVTTEKRLSEQTPLPAFEEMQPGRKINLPGGKALIVAEAGVATARSADGDIPWDFRPGAEHRFVDLHGPDREFATIEYGPDGQRFFLGREVDFAELGLPLPGEDEGFLHTPNTAALQLNCPQCAGPLALVVPDQTQRVCCPNCHALLDCQQGKLEYLETIRPKAKEQIVIPLGSVGKLFDVEYTVIGFMERYAMYEGKMYPWSEYLLYNRNIGFRWLVRNKGHWSFVEPVQVTETPDGGQVVYEGVRYRLYDRGEATARYVAGEFYWRLTAGETVTTADYIAPPYMLSYEKSWSENGQELNVSRGTYLDFETLETAFGMTDIPRPWGVGTIQPQPGRADVWLVWAGLVLLLLLLNGVFLAGSSGPKVGQFHFFTTLAAVSLWPAALLMYRHGVEVSRWSDSDYSPYAQGGSDE